MPGTKISTTIDSAITLGSAAYMGPISITNTGAIEPVQYGGTALTVPAHAADATVTNHGLIVGGYGTSPGGMPGPPGGAGVKAGAGARIVNDGTIVGGGSAGYQYINQGNHKFDGGGDGVDIHGAHARLINNAVIDGGADAVGYGGIGVSVSSGAVVVNHGTIAGGASVESSHAGVGVSIQNATLINYGTIEAGANQYDRTGAIGANGVDLNGGKMINHGVVIGGAGGTLERENYGYVVGGAGYGVTITAAGSRLINDGKIQGGAGAKQGGTGGAGVSAYGTSTIVNNGLIEGGKSGERAPSEYYYYSGFGGAGAVLSGGASLTNHGVILGGAGGADGGIGGDGAALISRNENSYVPAFLTNDSIIAGGAGGFASGVGGSGIFVNEFLGSVSNAGAVAGGVGGAAGYSAYFKKYMADGGEGGAGLELFASANPNALVTGTNTGIILGGNGGAAGKSGLMGHGGTGLILADKVVFNNKGIIQGGNGGVARSQYRVGFDTGAGYGAVIRYDAQLINTGIIAAGQSEAAGNNGAAGVYVMPLGTLTNMGTIIGGTAGQAESPGGQGGGVGGAGLLQDIGYAFNAGTILAGAGSNAGASAKYFAGNGGYGAVIRGDVNLPGYQATFKNSGIIIAGAGGSANSHNLFGGDGGTGLTLTGASVVNTGVILGGQGGAGKYAGGGGGRGGVGVYVGAYGSLTNIGLIAGGSGGYGASRGSDGATGLYIGANSGSVRNFGTIIGGNSGDYGPSHLPGGFGGDGLSLYGGSFTNDGKISGGSGGGFSQGGSGVVLGNAVLTNSKDGSIQGGYFASANLGASGVYISGDGSLANAGQIVGGAVEYRQSDNPNGVGQGGAGVTLQFTSSGSNSGSITGGAAGSLGVNSQGVAGGTGLYMFTYISGYNPNKPNTTFFNSGQITGGAGGTGSQYGGAGGEGVYLSYGTLTNAGTITGGSGGYGKLGSGPNGDAVRLGVHATLIVENGAVFNGLVLAESVPGKFADTLELSGTSSTPLSGIGTQIFGFGDIAFAANAAWTIAGDTAGLASGQAIKGFTSSDAIELTDAAAGSGQVSVGTAGIVTITAGGDTDELDIKGATVGESNFSFSDYTLRESIMSPAPAMLFLRPAEPASASASAFRALGLEAFISAPAFHPSLPAGTETAAWANHPGLAAGLQFGLFQDISKPPQGEVRTFVTLHA